MKLIDTAVTCLIPAPAKTCSTSGSTPRVLVARGSAPSASSWTRSWTAFYLGVKHEGRTWPHYGRFVLIERPHQVQYTWVSEATKGVESVVVVTFQPRGDQTEVTLRHSGVPNDEMGHQHQEGWTWVLSMLAERFVPRRSVPAST